jgi:ABC-type branched-subunit amino acid transport system ATPase component
MSLQTCGVGATFGGLVALADADVTLERGQVVSVIGPNGSGKSTLFNCITGFVPMSSGTVLVDGEDVTRQPAHRRIQRGVARTFQTPRIDADLTVLTTVLCGFLPTVRSSLLSCVAALPSVLRDERRARKQAMELLESFGLAHLAHVRMGELPLGQLRLIDVVRAMAMQPKYLLLDEPAAGLANDEQQMLKAEIRRIAAADVGVLLVEHNFQLVRSLADEVVVLQKGKVLLSGPPETVATDPRVVDAYLGARHAGGERTQEDAARSATRRARSSEVVLCVRGLDVAYGRASVCRGVDVSVRAGRLTALLGPNGAGKSSLLAALAGNRLDNRRWSGEVILDGQSLDRLGADARAAVGIAFVPEARGNVFAGLTVEENLRLGLRKLGPERAEVQGLILEVFPPLAGHMGKVAGMLSGGEQQMVAIGMALARRPKVLLLDEPSQGLAPAVLDVLVDAFETLRERGLAILLAEQNQSFAAALADDFLVLAHGEVVTVGDAADLERRDEIAAAYL